MVITSKFIGNPGSAIVHIPGRASFTEKLAGKKVSVNSYEGDVTVNVPPQSCLCLAPYISSRAVFIRSDKYNSVVVSPIMNALSP
jgi:hypothetical protein